MTLPRASEEAGVPAAELLAGGLCSAPCLLAREPGGLCTCRCGGRWHGALIEAVAEPAGPVRPCTGRVQAVARNADTCPDEPYDAWWYPWWQSYRCQDPMDLWELLSAFAPVVSCTEALGWVLADRRKEPSEAATHVWAQQDSEHRESADPPSTWSAHYDIRYVRPDLAKFDSAAAATLTGFLLVLREAGICTAVHVSEDVGTAQGFRSAVEAQVTTFIFQNFLLGGGCVGAERIIAALARSPGNRAASPPGACS